MSAERINAVAGPTRIAGYEIHTIETGQFALDGGAMFGIVPKTIWSRTNPADVLNRIEMRLRCLLLVEAEPTATETPALTLGDRRPSGGRVILIDNGIGTKWAEKQLRLYGIDHSRWSLDTELAKLGLLPADVTDLIATHLHFDHMGGTTRRIGQELVPTFPNARLWVQEANWDLAWHPNEKDRASYLQENFDLYRDSSSLQLLQTPYGSRERLLPGIFVRVSNGHSAGLQVVEIADERASLIYCADAIPTASHVRVPFVMGYDCHPLTMIEEKKKLLREAEERGTILYFEHCPRAEAATVFHDGKDFAIRQAYHFSRGDR